MMIFLTAFGVMALVVLAMSVGVMFTGREIKGTCGGINNFEGGTCGVCGATSECEAPEKMQSEKL